MSPVLSVLIAISESVGVGLLGLVVLRLLRQYPAGYSLVAVVVITVGALNASTVTLVFITKSAELPVTTALTVNLVAGLVSVGIGVLLGRSVMTGSRQLAEATRSFGLDHRFRLPDDPPSAEFAELAHELHNTSEKLAESRRRERDAETSRRQLVAWISHDLRSPLARLRILSESIEDGVVDDLPDYCRRIRADTERLTGMVDDLFELSRIQAGALHLTPQNAALDDLVSDVVADLEVLAGSRATRIRARTIEPVPVRVDERAMNRVFSNLLVNAIQYSPENTTVTIDVRDSDGWAMVSIADECGGIAESDIGSLFDTGWRRGDRSVDSGGGLGLAIVWGIVQAHRGTVSVRNVAGGCCFDVRLPVN